MITSSVSAMVLRISLGSHLGMAPWKSSPKLKRFWAQISVSSSRAWKPYTANWLSKTSTSCSSSRAISSALTKTHTAQPLFPIVKLGWHPSLSSWRRKNRPPESFTSSMQSTWNATRTYSSPVISPRAKINLTDFKLIGNHRR